MLRNISARKSILNFTADEIKITKVWKNRFATDLKKKSPYFRNENGDWRETEKAKVNIIKIKDSDISFKKIKLDIKSHKIPRDDVKNRDTQWNIQISRRGLEDSITYAIKHKDLTTIGSMYNLSEIISNSILLDTNISEKNNNSKAAGTLFMHKLYNVCIYQNKPCLLKLSIEEMFDYKGGSLKRLYNVQSIKTEPLRHLTFTDKRLALSVLNGSTISISDLFKIVKAFDKNFYTNKQSEKTKQIVKEDKPSLIANHKNKIKEAEDYNNGREPPTKDPDKER